MNQHIHYFRLDNGVTVALAPLPHTKTTTFAVSYGVGSRHESVAENGASHFLEHMAYRGTPQHPTNLSISRVIEPLGGSDDASTSCDSTEFSVSCPPHHWQTCADISVDSVLHPLLRPEDIEMERHVIHEEAVEDLNDPREIIARLGMEVMYGESSIGQPIVGSLANIGRFQRADLRRFRRRHYVTGNMLVTLAGSFETNDARQFIRRQFGDLTAHARPADLPPPVLPSRPAVRLRAIADLEQAQVILAFPAFGSQDKRFPALRLLTHAFGGLAYSRLAMEVRENSGLAYYAKTGENDYTDTGDFYVNAGINSERLPQALELMVDLLRQLRDGGLSPSDFADAKASFLNNLPLINETSEEVTSSLIDDHLSYGRTRTLEERLATFQAVTFEQAQAVAHDVIRADRLRIALLTPKGFKRQQFLHLPRRLAS